MTDYAAVLRLRHKGREWKIDGNDYDTLEMLDDGDKPTKKELDAEWPAVATEIAAAVDAKAAAAASARAKLAKLGLTDDELKAFLGV